MENLGDRLRRLREARSMTLDDLASGSGISKSMLSRLETGARESLTLERAVDLCDVLGISLDELAGRTTGKPNAKRQKTLARARKLAEDLQKALGELG